MMRRPDRKAWHPGQSVPDSHRKPGGNCGAKWGTGHNRCYKPGKVKVILMLEGGTKNVALRCWEHYLELENQCRRVDSPQKIVEAQIVEPQLKNRKGDKDDAVAEVKHGGMLRRLPDR